MERKTTQRQFGETHGQMCRRMVPSRSEPRAPLSFAVATEILEDCFTVTIFGVFARQKQLQTFGKVLE